jgi:cation diffusion facilitator family transporter
MSASKAPYLARERLERDRRIRKVIVVEGGANLLVLSAKLAVGLSTGSFSILGDALHSLGDLANNVVAWFIVRLSAQPPDRHHPYGHRKFETLAVFVLASLLTVLGFELIVGALQRETLPTPGHAWSLPLMLGVLVVNIVLAVWQGVQARRLESEILRADARHTLSDVLTTIAVIAGWQISARQYPWVDTLFALLVAALVLSLAFGLFRRAVPILVDRSAVAPEKIDRVTRVVDGVLDVRDVRSRSKGKATAVDMIVVVAAHLSIEESHDIADAVEARLRSELSIEDATIHIEPESRDLV